MHLHMQPGSPPGSRAELPAWTLWDFGGFSPLSRFAHAQVSPSSPGGGLPPARKRLLREAEPADLGVFISGFWGFR